MGLNIKFADNRLELETCLSIREKVFVEEQNIPVDIEMDDNNVDSVSICAITNEKYVGTARYRVTSYGFKLERFAVLKEFRNQGIGKALAQFMFDNLNESRIIYLHAQEAVVDFYLSLGFKKINDRFFEAGIPHWKMVKK
tara:strand:- start:1409 stop:1828 length:420 start_codon:yes stop_codon:yes gene_type:complete